MKRTEHIAGLRELADFYEAHPAFPMPCNTFNVFVSDENPREEMAKFAKMLAPCEKDTLGDEWFLLRRRFGPVIIEVNARRQQVCTARVVRVEHVPEHTIPETVIPAKDVEVIEWDCPSLFSGEAADGPANVL